MGFFNMRMIFTGTPHMLPCPPSPPLWLQIWELTPTDWGLTGREQPGGGGAIGYWRPFHVPPTVVTAFAADNFCIQMSWIQYEYTFTALPKYWKTLPHPQQLSQQFVFARAELKPIQGDFIPLTKFWKPPSLVPSSASHWPQLCQVKSAELLRIAQERLRRTVQHWAGQVLQNRQSLTSTAPFSTI